MPAPSSPMPAGLGQPAHAGPGHTGHLPNLLDRLRHLPNPRRPQGRRHPLPFVLALVARAVLAQREVDAKSNAITAFRPLPEPLDLARAVATFDALPTRADHAAFLAGQKSAHYIAVVKGDHPILHRLVKKLPWKDVPLADRTRERAHGRDEIRRLKIAAVADVPFPHQWGGLQ